MKKPFRVLSAIALVLCGILVNAQNLNFGLWEYFGGPSSPKTYAINGRLTNFLWKDIEPSNGKFEWSAFDQKLSDRTSDGLPAIFLVFTKEDAPDWLYQNGVPKVIEKDSDGRVSGHSPYYANENYKYFFKRMITKVREHVETLPSSVRNNIVGVQACFGSTGDYISYKGTVDSEYALTQNDFFELFKEFSLHYYNEYKNTNPQIVLLSNPKNDGQGQNDWLIENCPGWIKCGTLAKGYELNDEKTKATWLYNTLNRPYNGTYIRARSEMSQQQSMYAGWWNEYKYRNQFANVCYSIYWGLDWSNQGLADFKDQNSDSVFRFFNKYAGQKDPLTSTNALCALKDVLDAADENRFPASVFGTIDRNNTQRYQNIVNKYVAYGAKMGDPSKVNALELDMLNANSINDVGWDLLPGNYERFLYQIDANSTSIGYWNVEASADLNSMYGKFGRGFDLKSGKNALYFNVDDAFLRYQAVDGSYPVTIDITYLDKGKGSFGVYYDSKTGGTEKLAKTITCSNSNKWKTVSILITDAYFFNRGPKGSDFSIRSKSNENVIFSHIELSRPDADLSDVGLVASTLAPFDTICYTAESLPQSFILSGHFLDGSDIVVGPYPNFKFATTANSTYLDSLILGGYGTSINSAIFVKFVPASKEVLVNGLIPVTGGGNTLTVPVIARSVNSLPSVGETKTDISCFNKNDGEISLQLSNGTGPFTYNWSSPDFRSFNAGSKDISNLKAGNYVLTLTSAYNCSYSNSYLINNPERLGVDFMLDSAILCKGGTTTLQVFATGGTAPFQGTGTFESGAGFKTYTITDARGCTTSKGYNIANGTKTFPAKPNTITGNLAAEIGLCSGGDFDFATSKVSDASSYVWTLPSGADIISSKNEGLSIIANLISTRNDQNISVRAANACGLSAVYSKVFKYLPANPGNISGPVKVKENQTATYSVTGKTGLTYLWTLPAKAEILSGQNTPSITVKWGNRSGKVTVKASNDCGLSTPSTLDVTVSTTFGVDAEEEESASIKKVESFISSITISPNPVTSRFMVQAKGNIDMIRIYDISGRLIFTQKVNAASVQIDRAELKAANGTYFMLITSTGKTYREKLILQ